MKLTQDDADTILRIKAATMRANGYTGAVAIYINSTSKSAVKWLMRQLF